jgi:hypothetical protein
MSILFVNPESVKPRSKHWSVGLELLLSWIFTPANLKASARLGAYTDRGILKSLVVPISIISSCGHCEMGGIGEAPDLARMARTW